ncbi:MAG: Asp23/Gls24 family envelope stress response protein [Oscillospiraceae bacterium]|nr:Asp23/Gls24 family envelope stress response protein [Oscillospiraceae bacterium]MBQ3381381.1 Asp23/Gls24 family envelope stress response protein [Oscillospiraceae bacterium]MBQ6316506.1 Asp23/Gls24 family envelope stress response protein [Oscillospiraceae bacterium]MBQ6612012.1 Asp23/Gls24 family envelope stress response protein [Oscillospiraceae bacterium]MBQ9332028.1 Asp23/Gls24 family envelope stress response protein [Oscillospiraceae bacterium]
MNITNESGTIRITDDVFTNLAGDAATSCFGVKGMAGRSKDGGPLQLLRRESMSKGVVVHYNDEDDSISLELHIGVDQGVNMAAVARSIMKEVSYKLTKNTGVPVKAVDVYIDTIIG